MASRTDALRTPREVTGFFEQKNLKPAFSVLDVWGQEHAHNFMISKALEAELLGAFKSTIQSGLDRSITFEKWVEELKPELVKLGWWGPRLVADPLGLEPDRKVNFAAPGRLQTIFHANMRSARAAGQWERMQRSKRALPYILYVRTSSKEPRAEHLAFEGIVLPIDHPWWRTHFPPNGWRCKCSVRQITRREATKLGYVEGSGEPQVVMRGYFNRRTGQTVEVPEGIDPGWAANPGIDRSRTIIRNFSEKVGRQPDEVIKSAIGDVWASQTPQTYVRLPDRLDLPVAMARVAADRLGAQGSMASASTAMMKAKTNQHRVTEVSSFALVQKIVDEGDITYRAAKGTEPETVRAWLEIEGTMWLAAFRKTGPGYLRLVSLFQKHANELAGAMKREEVLQMRKVEAGD
ncbi:MAG: phage minor head protein [Pseudomonadota bacterium]